MNRRAAAVLGLDVEPIRDPGGARKEPINAEYLAFGERLRAARIAAGLTTNAAAGASCARGLGFSQPYLTQVEEGRIRHVSAARLANLAAALGLEYGRLTRHAPDGMITAGRADRAKRSERNRAE